MFEFAPAKVNLYLHVVGRRADGMHLLDSLAIFPEVGDGVEAELSEGLSLSLSGPFADGLAADADNLVLKAAACFPGQRGAALRLYKNLPIASGIGGGSADGAATLRLLARLWGEQPPSGAAEALGADGPVCFTARPAYMRGVGEAVTPAPWAVSGAILLANPLRGVSTPAVFRRMTPEDFSGPAPNPPARFDSFAALIDWLRPLRDDMTAAALSLCPEIGEILAALSAQPGCALARMSGSGATCFGLFQTAAEAEAAEAALRRARPGWWLATGGLT